MNGNSSPKTYKHLHIFRILSLSPTLAFVILKGHGRTASHQGPFSIIARPSLLRRPHCYLSSCLPFPLATSSYPCLPYLAILLLPPLSHPPLPSSRILSSPPAPSHIFIFPPTSSSCLSLLWCLNLKPNWIPAVVYPRDCARIMLPNSCSHTVVPAAVPDMLQ